MPAADAPVSARPLPDRASDDAAGGVSDLRFLAIVL